MAVFTTYLVEFFYIILTLLANKLHGTYVRLCFYLKKYIHIVGKDHSQFDSKNKFLLSLKWYET